jgi:hypothetical protein
VLLPGVAGWVLIAGSTLEQFHGGLSDLAVLASSVGVSVVFLYFWHRLFTVFEASREDEDGFRRMVRDDA